MPALSLLRSRAFAAQDGRCYYCGAPMWLTDPDAFRTRFGCTRGQLPALRATAEHLQAVQDGGPTTAENIVAAHRICNWRRHRAKAPLPPDRYRARVARLLAQGRWFDGSTPLPIRHANDPD